MSEQDEKLSVGEQIAEEWSEACNFMEYDGPALGKFINERIKPAAASPVAEEQEWTEKVLIAAENWDWLQTVLHQGEPCFHLSDDGYFCGRARQWPGHDDNHSFLPLACLLAKFNASLRALKARLSKAEGIISQISTQDAPKEVRKICRTFLVDCKTEPPSDSVKAQG